MSMGRKSSMIYTCKCGFETMEGTVYRMHMSRRHNIFPSQSRSKIV